MWLPGGWCGRVEFQSLLMLCGCCFYRLIVKRHQRLYNVTGFHGKLRLYSPPYLFCRNKIRTWRKVLYFYLADIMHYQVTNSSLTFAVTLLDDPAFNKSKWLPSSGTSKNRRPLEDPELTLSSPSTPATVYFPITNPELR